MAQVSIDVDRPVGRVDRRIFGGFIEHLGRCIYGGVFDEGSALADARGFRTDVLDAVRALAPTNVRWPGGNFVSGYHWADGVGPPAGRPRRAELAWGTEESNRFGTDEFLAWCEAVGTEPVICLNMGTGTLDEAIAWWSTATAQGTPTGPADVGPTGTRTPTGCGTGGSATRCTATGSSASAVPTTTYTPPGAGRALDVPDR